MTAFKDHFSSRAADYAAYRPTYPPELVDYLASVCPTSNLALDCGCGTGQLAVLLADRFKRVIATDASAQQIENAEPRERVTYRVAPAERSGLPDARISSSPRRRRIGSTGRRFTPRRAGWDGR